MTEGGKMGKLSIHCYGCGTEWDVLHRDDWKHWKARTCPVCGKEIDPGTWSRYILPAFNGMEDANIELMKDHTQSHGTLFTVSYIPDVVFPDAEDDDPVREEVESLREDIEDLKVGIEDLQRTVTNMFEGIFLIQGGSI